MASERQVAERLDLPLEHLERDAAFGYRGQCAGHLRTQLNAAGRA